LRPRVLRHVEPARETGAAPRDNSQADRADISVRGSRYDVCNRGAACICTARLRQSPIILRGVYRIADKSLIYKMNFIFLKKLCLAQRGSGADLAGEGDRFPQGPKTMLSKTKIVLSLALVLGTASAGIAATKHPVHHHQVAVERQLPGASAYGYAGDAGTVSSPNGPVDPYNHQQVKCIGGTCNPEWGIDGN
jgi:hypothetical protein